MQSIVDVRAPKRAAGKAPRMARQESKQDLRSWLDALRAAGEVREVSGAKRESEIGGIVDLHMRKMGNPAVLFDDIPGYPRGHRILANILTSVRRINLTLGLPIDGLSGRTGYRTNLGTRGRAPAVTNHAADHRPAHATTHGPTPLA